MSEILKKVSEYYTDKVRRYGLDSKGVDWNTRESQYLRFEKLFELVNHNEDTSILDYGCGTGEFVNFLKLKNKVCKYTGYDVSEQMTKVAKETHQSANCVFTHIEPRGHFDYVIGSGIFNVKMGFNDEEWHNYILASLEKFNNFSVKGFAFNILSLYSNPEKRRSDLYYADPLYYFDYCKRHFHPDIALLHNYPLFEFTILVSKRF